MGRIFKVRHCKVCKSEIEGRWWDGMCSACYTKQKRKEVWDAKPKVDLDELLIAVGKKRKELEEDD